MGMNVSGGRPRGEINVVPLIDIVLVLLIIFMAATPTMQRGYDLIIPMKADTPLPPKVEQLVVMLSDSGRIQVNQQETAPAALRDRLAELLRERQEKTVFFQCDDGVVYQEAIVAMDAIQAAGGTVGLMTTDPI